MTVKKRKPKQVDISDHAICILGTSRSGTSAVTRVINLLGAYLGEENDLMPAAADNPSGFWEHLDFYRLHENLLQDQHLSWSSSTLPLPASWRDHPDIRPYREQLLELVSRNFKHRKLWAWKDPRTCLLMPLWTDTLSQLGIALHCLLIVRNPLDVARSLATRNAISVPEGLGIWFSHLLCAARFSSGYPRSVLIFEDLMDDWQGETDRCIKELSLPWPRRPSGYRARVDDFLQPRLVHHRASPQQLQEQIREQVPSQRIADLYDLLLRAAREPGFLSDHDFKERIEILFSEFQEIGQFFERDRRVFLDEFKQKEKQLERSRSENELLSQRLETLRVENAGASSLMKLEQSFASTVKHLASDLEDIPRKVVERTEKLSDPSKPPSELGQEVQRDIHQLIQETSERLQNIQDGVGSTQEKALKQSENVATMFKETANTIGKLGTDLSRQTESLGSLQAELSEARLELTRNATERAGFEAKIGALQSNLSSTQTELTQHQAKSAELLATIGSLRTDLSSTKAALAQHVQERAALRVDLASTKTEFTQHQAKSSELSATITSLLADLSSAKSTLAKHSQERTVFHKEIVALQSIVVSAQAEARRERELRQEARKQTLQAVDRASELEQELESRAEALATLETKFDSLSQRIEADEASSRRMISGLSERLQRQNATTLAVTENVRKSLQGVENLTANARHTATMLWESKPWRLYMALGRAKRAVTGALSGRSETPTALPTHFESKEPYAEIEFQSNDRPRVSIIIPTFNGCDYTYRCLYSIYANTPPDLFEVIVVNDVSTDQTAEMLQEIRNARIITNPENLGFLRTINAGARQARGEFVVLFNNDTEVREGWLTSMLSLFDADPGVGAVGPKFVYPDGSLQEAGGLVWNDGSAWNYGNGDNPDKPEYNFVRETDYCTAAALMVRSELFNRLGQLDERYVPIYYEETDLCMAIRAEGYKVMYQPAAEVVHYEGLASGTDTSKGAKRFQAINRVKFLEKWKVVLGRDHLEKPSHPRDSKLFVATSRRARKRILVIDHYLPEYDKDSGSLRMFGWVKALADLGNRVAFLPDNGARTEPYASALQQIGVEVVWGGVDFDNYLRRHGRFLDIAILSRPHIAVKYIESFRAYPDVFLMYDTVDLGYVRELREADVKDSAQQRHKAEKLRSTELYLATQSDLVLTVSDIEKDVLLKEDPSLDVETIPHVLEPASDVPAFAERRDLMFIGGFNHPPNADAVLWFVDEVFPLVTKALPDVKFHIVGSHPPERVKSLASNRIVVTGYVEDVSPYFASNRVFVAPLRYGAGVKGKIMQSMSYGLPMVTTQIGAEGLHLVDGETAVVADDPVVFARGIVRLYEDEQLWSQLSYNSLELLKRTHTAAACRARFSEVLDTIDSAGYRGCQRLSRPAAPKLELTFTKE